MRWLEYEQSQAKMNLLNNAFSAFAAVRNAVYKNIKDPSWDQTAPDLPKPAAPQEQSKAQLVPEQEYHDEELAADKDNSSDSDSSSQSEADKKAIDAAVRTDFLTECVSFTWKLSSEKKGFLHLEALRSKAVCPESRSEITYCLIERSRMEREMLQEIMRKATMVVG